MQSLDSWVEIEREREHEKGEGVLTLMVFGIYKECVVSNSLVRKMRKKRYKDKVWLQTDL